MEREFDGWQFSKNWLVQVLVYIKKIFHLAFPERKKDKVKILASDWSILFKSRDLNTGL